MKKTFYYTLHFTGFSVGASENQSYLRLIAHDHVFYTDKRDFLNPEHFSRLKPGKPLHIGTHRLEGNHYWIHWLSDGKTLLEPGYAREPLTRPLQITSIGIFLLTAAVWLLFIGGDAWRTGLGVFLAMLGLVIVSTGLIPLLRRAVLARSDDMRELRTRMHQARHGDYAFCEAIGPQEEPPRPSLVIPEDIVLPERYAYANWQAEVVNFRTWPAYSQRTSLDHYRITLKCDKTYLNLTWDFMAYSSWPYPIFRYLTPPFIASDDSVMAFYLPQTNEIQALYNANDQSSYLRIQNLYFDERGYGALYLFFFLLALFVTLCGLGMNVLDVLTSGSLDYWDWWKMGDTVLSLFPVSLLCSCAIIMFFELSQLCCRLIFSRINDWLILQNLINKITASDGKKVRHQGFK